MSVDLGVGLRGKGMSANMIKMITLSKKLKSALFASILSLALWPAGDAQAVAIRLAHPDVDIVVAPGQVKSDSLAIENPSDQEITLKIYAEDWAYKDTGAGEKDFFPAGSQPDSAAKWITLNPLEMVMPPFSRRDVRYTLTVPNDPNMKGTYRAVIFYESAAGTARDAQGATVFVSARIGTIIKAGIQGTLKREGLIEKIDITPPRGSKPAAFDITFKNTGNTDIRLKGDVLIMDAQGMPKGRGTLEELITSSGLSGTRRSEWAGTLAPGTYDLIFTLDLGEGQLLTEERKMTVESAASS